MSCPDTETLSRRRRVHTALLLGCAALALAPAAFAVEYEFDAAVDQEASYDTNIALSAIDDEQVAGYVLRPRATFVAALSGWQIRADTQLEFSRFSEDRFDSDDQSLSLTLGGSGPRQRWQIQGGLDRDSTRTQVEDLGTILAASRTEIRTYSAGYERQITPRHRVTANAGRSEIEYATRGFSDYDYENYELGWIYAFNPTTSLQVTAYATEVDFQRSAFPVDTQGLQLGINRVFNRSLDAGFSLGTREVESTEVRILNPTDPFCAFFGLCDTDFVRVDNTGFTAEANVAYQARSWRVTASLGRSVSPSGLGFLRESDTLRARFIRELTPRLVAELSLLASAENSVDESTTFDRDRLTLEPSIAWNFRPNWKLVGLVRHRMLDTTRLAVAGQVDADSTIYALRLRWDPPARRWAR